MARVRSSGPIPGQRRLAANRYSTGISQTHHPDMKTPTLPFALILSLFSLSGIPTTVVWSAEAEVAAAVPIPAANQGLLQKCLGFAQQLSDGTTKAKDVATTAAGIPFAGSYAKQALTKATATASTSEGLLGGIKNLLGGKPVGDDSVMSKVSSGALNLGETFKGLPGADQLQQLLGQPAITGALIKNLPIDKVPGYEAIQQVLKKLG